MNTATKIKSIILIFPNSLFKNNEIIRQHGKNSKIYIIEHPVYFDLYLYHKLKLILHRASMKCYADEIKEKYKVNVKYINSADYKKFITNITSKHSHFLFYDPVDKIIHNEFRDYKIETTIYDSKLFICDQEKINEYIHQKKTNKYPHSNFYIWMRKKFNVLIEKNKPVGNSWSFDQLNRNSFPANIDTKNMYTINPTNDKYVVAAKKYVNKYYSKNPGSDNFYLPINAQQTLTHFNLFLKKRLSKFGDYQDAVNSDIDVGFHSMLSPMLNIGLITPDYIIKQVEKYGLENSISISSIEGFVRQILGWREIMRIIYLKESDFMTTSNFFNHNSDLNHNTWYKFDTTKKSTGFNVIDDCLYKVYEIGYLHHIERLMYIGNYMLLMRIDPQQCYDWFMTFFVDSYNWVMMANVYAMSQYATGPLLTKRPYFSSSSYISKMSNYKKDKTNNIVLKINGENKIFPWFVVWDSLYYKFIADNSKILSSTYTISYQVTTYKKKSQKEKNIIDKIYHAYRDTY